MWGSCARPDAGRWTAVLHVLKRIAVAGSVRHQCLERGGGPAALAGVAYFVHPDRLSSSTRVISPI